jgi:di/tricarboxylate transporter
MEPWIVIGLLITAVALFATEKVSVDIVTLGLLSILVLAGILSVEEAFAGFSSSVIVMLASIFVIGAALRETGVLDALGDLIMRGFGRSLGQLQLVLMSGVAGVSAFMNNTTVTAMFLGPVTSVARRMKIAPSRLLMGLAFSSIMGGTCTVIGTSTNVAVSGFLKKSGMDEIGMFEPAKVGLILVVTGILYMGFVGVRLLPDRSKSSSGGDGGVRQYLAEVIILPNSPIIGQRVFRSDFSVMEFQVLRIVRDKEEIEPRRSERFRENDVVLVAGEVQNLMKVKKIEGLDIVEDLNLRASGIDTSDALAAEVVLTPRSGLVGRSLKESRFRQRTGLSVLAIVRGDRSIVQHIGDIRMHAGDLLLVQGPAEHIRTYEENSEMVIISQHNFAPNARRRGLALLGLFVAAVALSTVGIVPTAIAFLIVALLAVLTRCVTLETAYENIDWRLLILISGMTAFGTAMEHSHADRLMADAVMSQLAPFGPGAVLAGFCVLAAILTQPMSNAAAALVVLPVAMHAANVMGVDPRPFAFGVMLSASCSLITPFEPSCILVVGPGKYRFADFLLVGGLLTLTLVTIIVLLVPVFWPFHRA